MAPRRRVDWTEEGQRSLEEVVSYLLAESPSPARRVLAEALQAAASLSTLSERGRVVPEVGDPTIREIFVYRYRLLYRVSPDTVFVLAFIHGARDFARWRQDVES